MTEVKESGFTQFLRKLGFSPTGEEAGRFVYTVEINQNQKTEVEFVYASQSPDFDKKVYESHRRIWNTNSASAFVLVSETNSFVINPKIKPDESNSFRGKIESFKTGINTELDPEASQWLSRKQINAGYFFEFVREKIKRNKEQEVDKDLLLNLIALRLDLSAGNGSESVADLLILRCLFLKYLEDRGIYPPGYVLGVLRSGQATDLLRAFDAVGRINGDIFKNEPLSQTDFSGDQIKYLYRFFNSDYRSGQGTLFPYEFQHIPIQLISHVYEAFLNDSKKHGKGIYYTPQFIVRFMLEETLSPILIANQDVSVMDPACGSGAFLVESFRKIVHAKDVPFDFDAKKNILVNQIFGIDNDAQALRIAAFSLYLALLEDLDSGFIRKQIEDNAPILPNLIGNNLLHGNTLTDDNLFEGRTFGCIIGNPPWGSVPDDDDPEHKKERKAIGGKDNIGTNPQYKSVADFQRSQAFILRISKWLQPNSLSGFIVNNSNFLNNKSESFRRFFLQNFKLVSFFELSQLTPILFKKKGIGSVNGKKIEVGANEPACFLVVSPKSGSENRVQYIAPQLTSLSKLLKIVHFTQRDVKMVPHGAFIEDDLLWKILVNGSWDDYQLITQKLAERDPNFEIECRSGFQPEKGMIPTGDPDFRLLIKAGDVDAYFISETSRQFNWNQTLRRNPDEACFQGERLLIDNCPSGSNLFRLSLARVLGNEIFQDDVLCIKIRHKSEYVNNYLPFLGIFNSSLIGYLSYLTATQWGKGKPTRTTLRNSDLESLPLPVLNENDPRFLQLTEAVLEMERRKKDPFGGQTEALQTQIDELVFDLYGLLDFEKETIREFYDIHVHRKDVHATEQDLAAYAQKFKSVFELMLAEHLTLCCEYKISHQFGAFVCFKIVEKGSNVPAIKKSSIEDEAVFHAIKQAQLEDAFGSNRLNELPTRVYTSERFFLIKSNFFKDWTIRQAIEDANEEVKTMIQETQTTA